MPVQLATVTGDDSAHVSSASDSEHSCSSRSSLDSSGDSEYTADMSEMDTRAGGPPPVPVSTVQLPKGRVYTGQLSARKEPHGLGSYELRPANVRTSPPHCTCWWTVHIITRVATCIPSC